MKIKEKWYYYHLISFNSEYLIVIVGMSFDENLYIHDEVNRSIFFILKFTDTIIRYSFSLYQIRIIKE